MRGGHVADLQTAVKSINYALMQSLKMSPDDLEVVQRLISSFQHAINIASVL